MELQHRLKMDDDWFLKSPIDFEHKKYVLLDFLKKIEEEFSYGKIYPGFTEVVVHMASVQNFMKNQKYLTLNKHFEETDDEIMVHEIKEKKPRKKLKDVDYEELDKICKYSSIKFFEYFAIAKSIWSFVFETTHLKLKKGSPNLGLGIGLLFYFDSFNQKNYIWTYKLQRISDDYSDHKCVLTQMYYGDKKITSKTLKKILPENFNIFYDSLPMFEVKVSEKFDLNQSLIPIFKRKIMTHVFQTLRKMFENNLIIT